MTASTPIRPNRKEFNDQGRDLTPLPLVRPVVTTLGSSDVRPIEYVNGRLFGYHATDQDDLYVSDDDGATWSLYASGVAGTGLVRRILACADGEVLVVRAKNIVRSSFWSTTPTWTIKTTTSTVEGGGTASYREWSVDGDGTKFIASEYDGSWDTETQETHLWISTDEGDTWSEVIDHGTAPFADVETHGHGVCYDRWNDVFYYSIGHGDQGGIWASDDDGSTWTAIDITAHKLGRASSEYSSMTVMVATPRGIVCGTDDVPDGVYYIDTGVGIASQAVEQIMLDHSVNAGISYFAISGTYDETRDIVYITHNTQLVTTRPMGVIAVKGRQAARVWSWEEAAPVSLDQPQNITVNPTSGDVVMLIQPTSGTYHQLNAAYSGFGSPPAHWFDPGGVLGGGATDPINGGGVAVGIGSQAGEEATACGASALATGEGSTSVGNGATDGGNSGCTTIGQDAAASAGNGVAVGQDSTSALRGTACGRAADANQQDATSIGYAAESQGARATAVGSQSGAVANATAVGYNASAAHDHSVALGRDTATTATYQAMVGPRDIEITDTTKGIVIVSPDAARWRITIDNSGNLVTTSL